MVKEVNILGLDYSVREVPVVSKYDSLHGRIDFITQEIRIDGMLSDEKKEVVLLHEILHGICDALGFYDLSENEQVVQGLATALHHILKTQTIFS